jgi:dihydrofolate synthase/folylpolyglutamate synthase
MNYQETIEYLYRLLPVFHRVGAKAFKANLSNTLLLCEHLDNPQNKFKSIHIAGTNGKGSSSHYLSAILQRAGYKTGLYTSPHLKDYSERFRINGQAINKRKIIAFVKKNQAIIEKLQPSFFELSVALAFQYFAEEQVEIAVIEVGLGGRLDSTNIIMPELSLITNIGFDHTDILGDTLSKIASEKAGIIKEKIPVIISERHPETEAVFSSVASEKNAPIFFAEDDFETIEIEENNQLKLKMNVFDKDKHLIFKDLESELIGKYQLKNIKGVLKSVEVLNQKGFKITKEAIENGISNVVKLTGLKGRFQVLNQKPLLICDTAHNEHGLREVLKHIKKLKIDKKIFILGFVKDKDIASALKLFPKDGIFYFCQANLPRSETPENLMKIANLHNIQGYSILSVNEAIRKAKQIAGKEDLIYVGGSTFVVAEVNNL